MTLRDRERALAKSENEEIDEKRLPINYRIFIRYRIRLFSNGQNISLNFILGSDSAHLLLFAQLIGS